MKWFMCFLAMSAAVYGQELTNEQLVQYIPAGKKMALDAYLAKCGDLKISGYGKVRYTQGPGVGLTKEQTIAKFEETWAAAPGTVRKEWATKAYKSGGVAASEIAPPPAQPPAAGPEQERQITYNGDPATGGIARGGKLYPVNGGAATHFKSGSMWMPYNPKTHKQFVDP